jgi:branched-chain amino acid aminotransferase
MDEFRLFAVTAEGAKSIAVEENVSSIHHMLDNLPVGVYTAFRSFQHNKFLLLERHLRRLEESMAKLGWAYKIDQEALRKILHLVCTNYTFADSRIRIDVLARPIPVLEVGSRLFIAQGPHVSLSKAVYNEGVQVGIAWQLKRPDPQVKSADFVMKRRSFLEKRRGLFEALLIDEQGYIMEGASSNFYAIKDGVLWTADRGVLEGTARTILIEVAKEMKMPIRYAAVHMDDIRRLSECGISSSSRDIVPVVKIDNQVIGNGLPGPHTRKLLGAYRTYVEQAIMPAVELDDNSQAR